VFTWLHLIDALFDDRVAKLASVELCEMSKYCTRTSSLQELALLDLKKLLQTQTNKIITIIRILPFCHFE
jgi:hypothetical protein